MKAIIKIDVTDRNQLIESILRLIEKTHNDKDKSDLLEFSDNELKKIYIELIQSNK